MNTDFAAWLRERANAVEASGREFAAVMAVALREAADDVFSASADAAP